MVNVMDYSCPVCGGKDPNCQECEGTGIVRMLAGTKPEPFEFDDGPECPGCDGQCECTACEYRWHEEFVNWFLATRGHVPQPLDPIAEAVERAFHAGWTAAGGTP